MSVLSYSAGSQSPSWRVNAASIPTYVFVQAPKEGEAKPVAKMSNTGRKSARERVADKWEEERGEPAPAGF